MMRPKQASKRKNQRRSMALPVLGAAGLSLAMTGNTSATVPATHLPFQGTGPGINLGEEEISDVSLATFYVFDRENDAKPSQDIILARGGCGHGCGGGGGAVADVAVVAATAVEAAEGAAAVAASGLGPA